MEYDYLFRHFYDHIIHYYKKTCTGILRLKHEVCMVAYNKVVFSIPHRIHLGYIAMCNYVNYVVKIYKLG